MLSYSISSIVGEKKVLQQKTMHCLEDPPTIGLILISGGFSTTLEIIEAYSNASSSCLQMCKLGPAQFKSLPSPTAEEANVASICMFFSIFLIYKYAFSLDSPLNQLQHPPGTLELNLLTHVHVCILMTVIFLKCLLTIVSNILYCFHLFTEQVLSLIFISRLKRLSIFHPSQK